MTATPVQAMMNPLLPHYRCYNHLQGFQGVSTPTSTRHIAHAIGFNPSHKKPSYISCIAPGYLSHHSKLQPGDFVALYSQPSSTQTPENSWSIITSLKTQRTAPYGRTPMEKNSAASPKASPAQYKAPAP
eukprot:CCRYP_002478-RA/>CCRYP_002478-RA protein AED:0.44 eAED:0.56 QI:0/0/0/1/0/0/2/0/129